MTRRYSNNGLVRILQASSGFGPAQQTACDIVLRLQPVPHINVAFTHVSQTGQVAGR